MNKDLVEQIIARKTHCFFVSPHLDDAIFSAGGLINELSGKVPMTVINVFTSCGDSKNTLSAKAYLKQCGYDSKEKLFLDRVEEDKKIFDELGIEVINLGEVDALWRQKEGFLPKQLGSVLPELGNVYPTHRFHISLGRLSRHDNKLIDKLSDKIVSLLPEDNYIVFSPIGTGNHVDHLVIRESCLSVIPREKLVFWSDFPYLLSANDDQSFTKKQLLNPLKINIDVKDKISLCKKYYSQYSEVIQEDKNIKKTEQFYKFTSEDNRSCILETNVFGYLPALFAMPKDFIFNFLNPNTQKIIYQSFDSSNHKKAQEIISNITKKIPEAKCHLIGSTGLKISGQGDLDILVETQVKNSKKYIATVTNLFGPCHKSKPGFIQWKIKYQGVNVDLDLIDPGSSRFKIQTDIFNILNSSRKLRNQYEILKYQAGSTQTFKYSVAKILFFNKLLNGSVKPFPKYLNDYQFVQNFGEEKHFGDYQFALYKDSAGEMYFVKKWTGKRKNRAYHFLKNEVESYKYLNLCKSVNDITVPKLINIIEDKDTLCVILERVGGKDLSNLTPNDKINLFEKAMQFLASTNIPSSKYKIDKRPPLFWIAILPLITIKAIILHPKLLVPILKGFCFVVSNSARLISRKQRSLIHRDFNDYNILMGKKNNCLIDFQLASVADPIIDRVVLFLKYTYDPLMITTIKNHRNTQKIMLNISTREAFFTYLAIFSIYDLSLPDGSHSLSKQCLIKSINQSL